MLGLALKILFRLFFGLFSKLESSLAPELGQRSQGQTAVQAEVLARRVSQGLRKTLEVLENTLTQRIVALAQTPANGQSQTVKDTKEIDELTAQIAELKADLRILHRTMAQSQHPVEKP